ncbi:MAG: glycosyltransferase [Thermoguttaceae bacterium]
MTLLNLSLAIFAVVVIIDVIHYVALWLFLRGVKTNEWKTPAVPYTPKVAVLLTLRGADPFLQRSLGGLLRQDYPNYTVFIVVDSETDPALAIAREIVDSEKSPQCHVEFVVVREHRTTCTLKCNSLTYAIAKIDPSHEIIAGLDADVNPHPTWLRSLVEPFSDERFVAASGQRWYVPERDNYGSLVRYLWNAAAVVQLCLYRITWGGSLAYRRTLVERSNLIELWQSAFTEDASIEHAVRQVGGKVAFVPSLFMVNRETCSLIPFHRWVKRQLLCAKLHHPTWFAVPIQAALINLPLVVAAGLLVTSLAFGNVAAALWSGGALLAYWLGVFGTLPIIECGIRRKLRERGEILKPWTLCTTLKTLLAVPLTQIVYTSAIIGVHFLKRVEWRGVWYEIGRDKSVHLVEYKPYAEVQTQRQDEAESL